MHYRSLGIRSIRSDIYCNLVQVMYKKGLVHSSVEQQSNADTRPAGSHITIITNP